MNTQFRKGIIEMCVLALIAKKDMYGYEIVQSIAEYTDINEGTVYPILRRLTKEEYFSALEQENSNKNMLTSMAAQADIYEKLIETEKNQLVIMQAIADLYEKENGGV